MKRAVLISLLFMTLWSCTNNKTVDTDWPEITKEAKPRTRWWWMGNDVDSANLAWNLQEMSRAGIGGVEVTPIYGVKGREAHYIDYLSPRWMNMMSFTVAEANRLGMGVDMNTGTGWPFGGPDITIEDAATKAIFQHYTLNGGERLKEKIVVQDVQQKGVAYFSKLMAYSSKGEILDLTEKVADDGTLDWTVPADQDYKLVALFIGKTLQQVKRAAPGGQGYVLNHFDKEAVMRYFGKYNQAFANHKNALPECFFNDSYEVYGADWTNDLLDEFEKRRNYKLQDYFPELLADGATETSVRVISDYRETIHEILLDNFTKPWTAWAHEHGSKTKNQAHGSPGNLVDLYAAVDIPECESFGNTDFDLPYLRKDSIRKNNDSDPTILKYASSAANITGKKYTSAETFTWLSEHFRTSLSQCKPEIDQMFTSGVNHVYFHGTTYSPKDADWPGWKFYASVDMSPTNTIWRDAPAFFSYITRTQSFLQSGTSDNDFLLYLPMYDMWEEQRGQYFTTFAIHGMRERLPKFCEAVDAIKACGYDVDYISDRFLQTTSVQNKLLRTEGATTYKALILPAVRFIPKETFAQIKRLAEEGATVIFIDQYPADVPGLHNLEERRKEFQVLLNEFPKIESFDRASQNSLGKGVILTGKDHKDIFSLTGVKSEPFVSEMGGQLIRHTHADGHHYFMAMLQNNPVDGWVPLGVKAKSAMFFNPMTGNKGQAAVRDANGNTEVYMQLKPGESIILKTFTHPINVEKWDYYQPTGSNTELKDGWHLSFSDSEPAVNESFSLGSLGSWTNLDNDILKKNKGTGCYEITFQLRKNEGSEYLLSLGDVRESARVKVNGQEVAVLYAVPFETRIGSFLKDGENTLEIEVTNLPANRIADYDRTGVQWRIFQEINFVSITYQPDMFNNWGIIPSGLLGPVVIHELQRINP